MGRRVPTYDPGAHSESDEGNSDDENEHSETFTDGAPTTDIDDVEDAENDGDEDSGLTTGITTIDTHQARSRG